MELRNHTLMYRVSQFSSNKSAEKQEKKPGVTDILIKPACKKIIRMKFNIRLETYNLRRRAKKMIWKNEEILDTEGETPAEWFIVTPKRVKRKKENRRPHAINHRNRCQSQLKGFIPFFPLVYCWDWYQRAYILTTWCCLGLFTVNFLFTPNEIRCKLN